ncbi:MAG TPA: hypothetical protein DCF97_05840 [Plesiomonas shigelloides]|nr:hypothetical protein [Plesiomonas shigelloides]
MLDPQSAAQLPESGGHFCASSTPEMWITARFSPLEAYSLAGWITPALIHTTIHIAIHKVSICLIKKNPHRRIITILVLILRMRIIHASSETYVD